MGFVKFVFSVLIACAFRIASSADLNTVKYIFYYGSLPSDKQSYNLKDMPDILQHSEFNQSKKTVLYVHGFSESQNSVSVGTILSAYRKRGDHNIIILDWSHLAIGNYFWYAAPNVFKLAPVVAASLLKLDLRVHLVGHSLGGQLVGAIGREIIKQSHNNTTCERITALDPAFPLFYPPLYGEALNSKDAKFVDVIHTAAGIIGVPVPTGTVDFWPNGGVIQPGCPSLNDSRVFCSHWRSWEYWAESVSNTYPEKFNAVKCRSWYWFRLGILTAEYDPNIVMGIDCPSNLSGNYYLETNSNSPFTKGKAGVRYELEMCNASQYEVDIMLPNEEEIF